MGDIISADENARSQSDATCDALTPPCPQPPASKVLKAYFANKIESAPPKGKTTPVTISFEKINSAIVGAKTWIVIETSELKSGTVTVEILGSDKEVIVAVDSALTVLEAGAEKSSLSGSVGNWVSKTQYANAATLTDKAIFEIQLRPKSDDTVKTWRTDIGKQTPKKSSFHLKVTATGGNCTEYNCEDDTLKSPNTEKGIFYNQKDHYFGIFGCFCDKDFEVWEMKKIYPKSKLFSAKNCPLPEADKTFEAFTKELNKAMKAYDINTCLRKAHFLGQADGETNLDTTLEHGDGASYEPSTFKQGHDKYALYKLNKLQKPNPYLAFGTDELENDYDNYNKCIKNGNKNTGDGAKYKGRGLMQLTWHNTYIAYLGATGDETTVASNLMLTCDSAAWYWKVRSSWGNLNLHADNDDFIFVTIGVNGGLNGFIKRKASLKRILNWMKLQDICNNSNVNSKEIGIYKYNTSNMKNFNFGKTNENNIKKMDD